MNSRLSSRLISVLKIMALFVALAPSVILCLSLLSGSLKPELLWLSLALAAAGGLCGSLSLLGHIAKGRTVILCAMASGFLLGGAGFTTGYYRPDLFGWHGDLAPVAGVFVTGPIGFLGGVLLGLVAGGIRALRCGLPEQNRSSMKSGPETPRNSELGDETRTLSS